MSLQALGYVGIEASSPPDRARHGTRFLGDEHTAEPCRPGRSISGFRTGTLGMGHAVLTVPRMEDVLPFYRDLLGFRVSDYVTNPFHAYFLHVNPRHHSL